MFNACSCILVKTLYQMQMLYPNMISWIFYKLTMFLTTKEISLYRVAFLTQLFEWNSWFSSPSTFEFYWLLQNSCMTSYYIESRKPTFYSICKQLQCCWWFRTPIFRYVWISQVLHENCCSVQSWMIFDHVQMHLNCALHYNQSIRLKYDFSK